MSVFARSDGSIATLMPNSLSLSTRLDSGQVLLTATALIPAPLPEVIHQVVESREPTVAVRTHDEALRVLATRDVAVSSAPSNPIDSVLELERMSQRQIRSIGVEEMARRMKAGDPDASPTSRTVTNGLAAEYPPDPRDTTP